MVFYLNTSLILIVVSGLICLTFGLIFLINGYLKKKKNRVERGWGLSILGLLVFVFFLIALTRILKQEAEEGSGFIFSSFLLLFIFFPIAVLFALVVSVFFLVIGINSLKEGYKKDDKATSTEITQRTVELKSFLRRYFNGKTASELKNTNNEDAIENEIKNGINDKILSSSRIRDVKLMQKDVIEQN